MIRRSRDHPPVLEGDRANLLNLEVDLLFFDTTSTYFERDTEDVPGEHGEEAFRRYGHSKDHRDDLPGGRVLFETAYVCGAGTRTLTSRPTARAIPPAGIGVPRAWWRCGLDRT